LYADLYISICLIACDYYQILLKCLNEFQYATLNERGRGCVRETECRVPARLIDIVHQFEIQNWK